MPRYLDIDAHGRVAPLSDEARRALADRAGRFALLPSAADLLVARRAPPAGGVTVRPRCILAGDLAGFPIADFFGFIHQARLSGTLTVSAGGVERSVAFKDGEVRSAQSTASGERVGEVAVKLGFLTEAQLAGAVGSAEQRPLGKALVDQGLLSPNDLWKCFHEQVTEVFHAILLSRQGVFFLVDEDAVAPGAPLAVNTQTLLMDGIRRIDEMSLFRARIPGPGAFLRRREPRRAMTLRPVETALLEQVDGRRTVAEVAAAAHLNEFDATKILYHLAEAGYVEAVGEPALAASDPQARLEALAAGLAELCRTVAAALPADARPPALSTVRAFLGDAASRFAPLWRGVAPEPDGGFEAAAVLANLEALRGPALVKLEPSGLPGHYLLDALKELLFFWLFLAGERISPEADEALSAQVKRRLSQLEGLGD